MRARRIPSDRHQAPDPGQAGGAKSPAGGAAAGLLACRVLQVTESDAGRTFLATYLPAQAEMVYVKRRSDT